MAIQYKQIEAFTHAVLGNVKHTSAAGAQTAYETTTALHNALRSGDYNRDFVRDAILNALANVAKAICETDKHPDRQLFREVVGPVVGTGITGTVLQPSLGPYGAFMDAVDGRPLEPRALHSVKRMLAPASAGIYQSDEHAYFAISGQQVWFVAPSNQLKYERFTWAKPALTVFDGATSSVFPDNYENVIVSGAVAEIAAKTDPQLATLHNGYYLAELGMIKAGAPYKPATWPASPEQ